MPVQLLESSYSSSLMSVMLGLKHIVSQLAQLISSYKGSNLNVNYLPITFLKCLLDLRFVRRFWTILEVYFIYYTNFYQICVSLFASVARKTLQTVSQKIFCNSSADFAFSTFSYTFRVWIS